MHNQIDMSLWQGRIDEDPSGQSLRWHQAVSPYQPGAAAGVTLLGIASDEGVRRNQGRIGAAAGPDRIRQALASQAFHLKRPLYDAGNLSCKDGDLESLQQQQTARVRELLDQGQFPLLLGGGHEIAYGSFAGLVEHLQGQGSIGIINFDAHFDLRQATQPTSGTPFLQMAELCQANAIPFDYLCLGISETANTAALYSQADKLGVLYLHDDEMTEANSAALCAELESFIAPCDALYLSIDLDVLPAATAPGVSAPAPYGVPLALLEKLIGCIRHHAGERLKLADLAEYNPLFDSDGRTAKVAARLCHQLTRPA